METNIRNIGNNKGIILPESYLDKFHSEKIDMILTGEGILLKPISDFQSRLKEAKKRKSEIYYNMKSDVEDQETQKYYNKKTEEDIG
ncbi:MAG: hypothetical protein AAF363_20760 [Bacteroidota bacterium]